MTQGDLTRTISVAAAGEIAELTANINTMIGNLRETTEINAQQDWLNTNMARFSSMLQGQRDIQEVSRLIMSELTPLVEAQHGAFFLVETAEEETTTLRLRASYGYRRRKGVANVVRARRGPRRPGGARAQDDPADAGAGGLHRDLLRASARASPVNIVVLPVLFEGEVLAVVELASLEPLQRARSWPSSTSSRRRSASS